MHDETQAFPEGEEEYKSKTRRKQEMHALQDIGEQLVALNAERLAKLGLPEDLLDAVTEAKRLTRHEAIRRQMQYIGKIMRTVDPAPIKTQLDAWNGASCEEAARLHLVERWRDRLLAGEEVMGELAAEYPRADLQQIRNLVRNALREKAADKPPKSSRALFKLLRETMLTQGGENPSAETE
jgi:ribosome-associated protein